MEGSSGRWDIEGVLEEVEMQAQDAVVSIDTTQADLVNRPASVSYTHLTLPTKRIV